MGKRIAIIQGHPDPAGGHFGHALAEAYAHGAREGGHEVLTLEVAQMALPLLRSQSEWETGPAPAAVADAQRDIAWAQHAVIVFPLWLGDMPAVLKGFFEQVFRPGFAIARDRAEWGRVCSKAARCAQREEPEAQHPRLLRICASAHDAHRYGGRP